MISGGDYKRNENNFNPILHFELEVNVKYVSKV
jgi:hypothetical protein